MIHDTQSAQISQKQDGCNRYIYISYVYMPSWKQCALPVITKMALQQLMHLGTWCTVTHNWYQWIKRMLNKLCKECNVSGHIIIIIIALKGNISGMLYVSMIAYILLVRFDHSVCRRSIMINYDHLYIYLYIKCQIWYENSMKHFLETVIFRIWKSENLKY